MEDMLQGLIDKVGLDKETAMKVVDFVKDNADKIPEWIGSAGLADKLPGGLGDMLK